MGRPGQQQRQWFNEYEHGALCCDEARDLAAALEVAAKAADAPECARLLQGVLSACERAAAAAAAAGTSAAEWKSRPAPTPQQPEA